SEDLPEPDSPVTTTRRSRGMSRLMFLRLCVRAPRIRISSICLRGCGGPATRPAGPGEPWPIGYYNRLARSTCVPASRVTHAVSMNRTDHADTAGPPPAASFAMTAPERRASVALAAVYASRMLGLFLVMPVLAVHAAGMPGGEDARLVGWALGVFGLTQALLQLPFGMASDRFGRKPVIYAGLVVFAAGSVLAAVAETLPALVAARALQGAGAVSAAVGALLADLTRDSQRTKAMAMVGASIGTSFAVSLVVAPWLYGLVGMGGLFLLTAAFALLAIALVRFAVPDPGSRPGVDAGGAGFAAVLREADLLRLDFGIFAQHAVQVALFVVIPGWLVARAGMPLADHWKVYLPAMVGSFALMVPVMVWAERRGRVRGLF